MDEGEICDKLDIRNKRIGIETKKKQCNRFRHKLPIEKEAHWVNWADSEGGAMSHKYRTTGMLFKD